MSFDAGTIKGSLDLDTTSFTRGFQEAHTHAESGAGKIREVCESIVTVFESALGPAVGEFAQQLQGVFAGFSEGPIIGSLNAITTALGFAREAVGEVAADFHRLGLEAEKAGTSVEFMDRFANVASTAGVGIEQLGMGFKILEERAAAAADGDKKASESFAKLGIDSTQLAELMKSPQALFERVRDSIGGMTSAFDRNSTAHALLGRAGASLIPVMSMSREEFDKTADAMDRLGGAVDEHSVKIGSDAARLQSYFEKAFEGIQRAVAKPILEYLSRHMDEIEPKIEAAVNAIVAAIGKGYAVIEAYAPEIIAAIEGVSGALGVLAVVSLPAIGTAATALLGPLAALAGAIAAPIAIAGALGIAFGELYTHSAVFRGDVQALIGILEALAIVMGKSLKEAFDWVVVQFKSATVDTGALKGAFEALKPALDAIYEIFHKIGEAMSWLQDKTTALIDKLNEAAGLAPGAPRTSGTAGMTAEQAAKELGVTYHPKEQSASQTASEANVQRPTSNVQVNQALQRPRQKWCRPPRTPPLLRW
jgi:hypothetical protein